MRIIVDHDLCSGHGRCAAVAPSVYSLDEEGYCAIVELDVNPGDEDAARSGADNCPERAITIIDE
jgi:ferredoxin